MLTKFFLSAEHDKKILFNIVEIIFHVQKSF